MMFICGHRFERLKYRIKNNFVKQAKIKIYFRPTPFFDEKDKISIIISKIAQYNTKIKDCTKTTTLDIIEAIKIKNYILNIFNCSTTNLLVEIISHRTLLQIKVGSTDRQCIQQSRKITKILQLNKKLVTNCNKPVNQQENIGAPLHTYSLLSRQPSMDKVNCNQINCNCFEMNISLDQGIDLKINIQLASNYHQIIKSSNEINSKWFCKKTALPFRESAGKINCIQFDKSCHYFHHLLYFSTNLVDNKIDIFKYCAIFPNLIMSRTNKYATIVANTIPNSVVSAAALNRMIPPVAQKRKQPNNSSGQVRAVDTTTGRKVVSQEAHRGGGLAGHLGSPTVGMNNRNETQRAINVDSSIDPPAATLNISKIDVIPCNVAYRARPCTSMSSPPSRPSGQALEDSSNGESDTLSENDNDERAADMSSAKSKQHRVSEVGANINAIKSAKKPRYQRRKEKQLEKRALAENRKKLYELQHMFDPQVVAARREENGAQLMARLERDCEKSAEREKRHHDKCIAQMGAYLDKQERNQKIAEKIAILATTKPRAFRVLPPRLVRHGTAADNKADTEAGKARLERIRAFAISEIAKRVASDQSGDSEVQPAIRTRPKWARAPGKRASITVIRDEQDTVQRDYQEFNASLVDQGTLRLLKGSTVPNITCMPEEQGVHTSTFIPKGQRIVAYLSVDDGVKRGTYVVLLDKEHRRNAANVPIDAANIDPRTGIPFVALARKCNTSHAKEHCNVTAIEVQVGDTPTLVYVALRDIVPGEELIIWYGNDHMLPPLPERRLDMDGQQFALIAHSRGRGLPPMEPVQTDEELMEAVAADTFYELVNTSGKRLVSTRVSSASAAYHEAEQRIRSFRKDQDKQHPIFESIDRFHQDILQRGAKPHQMSRNWISTTLYGSSPDSQHIAGKNIARLARIPATSDDELAFVLARLHPKNTSREVMFRSHCYVKLLIPLCNKKGPRGVISMQHTPEELDTLYRYCPYLYDVPEITLESLERCIETLQSMGDEDVAIRVFAVHPKLAQFLVIDYPAGNARYIYQMTITADGQVKVFHRADIDGLEQRYEMFHHIAHGKRSKLQDEGSDPMTSVERGDGGSQTTDAALGPTERDHVAAYFHTQRVGTEIDYTLSFPIYGDIQGGIRNIYVPSLHTSTTAAPRRIQQQNLFSIPFPRVEAIKEDLQTLHVAIIGTNPGISSSCYITAMMPIWYPVGTYTRAFPFRSQNGPSARALMLKTLYFAREVSSVSSTAFINLVENMMDHVRPHISIILVLINDGRTQYSWTEFQGHNATHLLHITAERGQFRKYQLADTAGLDEVSLLHVMLHGDRKTGTGNQTQNATAAEHAAQATSSSSSGTGRTVQLRKTSNSTIGRAAIAVESLHGDSGLSQTGSSTISQRSDDDDQHTDDDHSQVDTAQQPTHRFIIPHSSQRARDRLLKPAVQRNVKVLVAPIQQEEGWCIDVEEHWQHMSTVLIGPCTQQITRILKRNLEVSAKYFNEQLAAVGLHCKEDKLIQVPSMTTERGMRYYLMTLTAQVKAGTPRSDIVPAIFTMPDSFKVEDRRPAIQVQLLTRQFSQGCQKYTVAVAAAPSQCSPHAILPCIKTAIAGLFESEYDVVITSEQGICMCTVYVYNEQEVESLRTSLLINRSTTYDQDICCMICGQHILAWAVDQETVIKYYNESGAFRRAVPRTITVQAAMAATYDALVIQLRELGIPLGVGMTDVIVNRVSGPYRLERFQGIFKQQTLTCLLIADSVEDTHVPKMCQDLRAMTKNAAIVVEGERMANIINNIESGERSVHSEPVAASVSKQARIRNPNRVVIASGVTDNTIIKPSARDWRTASSAATSTVSTLSREDNQLIKRINHNIDQMQQQITDCRTEIQELKTDANKSVVTMASYREEIDGMLEARNKLLEASVDASLETFRVGLSAALRRSTANDDNHG